MAKAGSRSGREAPTYWSLIFGSTAEEPASRAVSPAEQKRTVEEEDQRTIRNLEEAVEKRRIKATTLQSQADALERHIIEQGQRGVSKQSLLQPFARLQQLKAQAAKAQASLQSAESQLRLVDSASAIDEDAEFTNLTRGLLDRKIAKINVDGVERARDAIEDNASRMAELEALVLSPVGQTLEQLQEADFEAQQRMENGLDDLLSKNVMDDLQHVQVPATPVYTPPRAPTLSARTPTPSGTGASRQQQQMEEMRRRLALHANGGHS